MFTFKGSKGLESKIFVTYIMNLPNFIHLTIPKTFYEFYGGGTDEDTKMGTG